MRVTATSGTLLNHIIVNRLAKVKRTGVIYVPSITDHRVVKISDNKLVYCEINYDRVICCQISYGNFSKFNVPDALRRITEINWDEADDLQDVDCIEQIISTRTNLIQLSLKELLKKRAP